MRRNSPAGRAAGRAEVLGCANRFRQDPASALEGQQRPDPTPIALSRKGRGRQVLATAQDVRPPKRERKPGTARILCRTPVLILACAATLLTAWLPALARLETWREENALAFGKGHRDRVVISDSGRVRLGHALKPLGSLDAAHVWDLAFGPKGDLFAATGDEGKVFHREPKDDHPWTVAYDAPDSQCFSLAIGPDGHAFAGTGPSGQVVDITDPKHPASRPDPGVKYIWDLAADPKGNLYAATGPTGQLWKRSPEGAWSLVFDSKHAHLLCVAVALDGSVYAGSDGEGLLYKVAPGGKVSVVYDAPQVEIRSLVIGPDGIVYAGTASDTSAGPGRASVPLLGNPLTGSSESRGPEFSSTATPSKPSQAPPQPPEPAKKDDVRPRNPQGSGVGGSASPRPVSVGDNAVYRIDREGVVREVFRARTLVFALALQNDRLLVGTGPEGQLYEVHDAGRESTPIARLDNGQILSLLSEPDGGLLLGTGDPGSVVRLEPGHVATGSIVSDVKDTRLISRFGSVSWRADQPKGTTIAVQVRTGNVAEPDPTWSDWSPEQTDPENAQSHVPAGRFVQYRVKLSTSDPSVTPDLTSVSLRYQSANLAPEITKLDVPDVSALDGTTRQTRLTFRWEVTDPNDDELHYDLHLRKEGWPDWVRLNEQPLSEKSFSWDATSVPSGLYRARITASDRPSNNLDDALTREKVSDYFLVDHEPPAVTITPAARRASATLKDKLTRIAKAAYAIDGGDWVPVFPDDGLFDTPTETVTIPLADLKPGTHILVVRATDAAGNVGTGDSLIDVH